MPSYKARMEYVKALQTRYRRASKAEKGRILAEFCETKSLQLPVGKG